eukprot:5697030-Pleurochrysis_carterae.AAC.1
MRRRGCAAGWPRVSPAVLLVDEHEVEKVLDREAVVDVAEGWRQLLKAAEEEPDRDRLACAAATRGDRAHAQGWRRRLRVRTRPTQARGLDLRVGREDGRCS